MNLNSDRYPAEGYCVFPQLLPASAIEALRTSLGCMLESQPEGTRPETLVEPHMLAEDWQFWLRTCVEPAVLDAVQSCLRCDELIFLMSHLIVKPAGDGIFVAWHQDNTYWPSVHGTDLTTVWLALDDVDRENSCMNVIPRSHANHDAMEMIPTDGTDLLHVRVEVTEDMKRSAIALKMKAGSASLHDSFIIHGSQKNLSQRRRAAFTIRYGNPASVDVNVEIHNKPVYYVRGDGTSMCPGYRSLLPDDPLPPTSGRETRKPGFFGR